MGPRGYRNSFQARTNTMQQEVVKELTVMPLYNPNYPAPKPVKAYCIKDGKLLVPRYFQENGFCVTRGKDIVFSFIGNLYPKQIEARSKIMAGVLRDGGGIVNIQTGGGKTFITLDIIASLGKRTLVLVHKSLLLNQWVSEIKKWLPNASVGIVQGKSKIIDTQFDITIAMIQTLTQIPTVPDIFGLVISDECHHFSAQTFSDNMFKIQGSQYILGLSATIQRKDGLDKIMYWHLGKVLVSQNVDRSEQPQTHIKILKNTCSQKSSNFASLVNKLTTSESRNKMIISTIMGLEGRNVLVLSASVAHVKLLNESIPGSRAMHANLNEVDRQEILESKIIIATYQMFSEGVSAAHLDTLVLASPKKDITQAIGRIYRKKHTVSPMIIDILDSGLENMYYARMKQYRVELGSFFKTYD